MAAFPVGRIKTELACDISAERLWCIEYLRRQAAINGEVDQDNLLFFLRKIAE